MARLPALPNAGFSFEGCGSASGGVEIEANWKAVAENFLECYHCPTAHPGFSTLIDVDPEAYRLSSDEWFSSQVGRYAGRLDGRGHRRLPAERRPPGGPLPLPVADVHHERAARPANLLAFVFVPLYPGRTLTISDYFFGDDAARSRSPT